MPSAAKHIPHFTRHGDERLISVLVSGGLDDLLAQALTETPSSACRVVEFIRTELAGKHRFVPAKT